MPGASRNRYSPLPSVRTATDPPRRTKVNVTFAAGSLHGASTRHTGVTGPRVTPPVSVTTAATTARTTPPRPPPLSTLSPMKSSQPVAERPRRPEWMKVRAPSADGRYFEVRKLLRGARLHTICEEARCPTSQSAGAAAPRRSDPRRDVHTGLPLLLRPLGHARPGRPARAATARANRRPDGVGHVVVTSVDRDDLADRGAAHYAATIRALRNKLPEATIEVLTPDFLGVEEVALATVLEARPDVFNHNIETVRRLHRRMRGGKASYEGALGLLRRAKELADYPVMTKSGIIVGLGETNDEVVDTLRDLRAHEVDVVTIGQYLQPSAKHATIDRWVHPDEFQWFRAPW